MSTLTAPRNMTNAQLTENISDAERLLGKARIFYGVNARATRELTAEVAVLRAEATRRGLAVKATEDLKDLPDHVLLQRHQDALTRERNLKDAGNTAAAKQARQEAAGVMREQQRRGRERGNSSLASEGGR